MLELFNLSKVSGKYPVLNNICMKIEAGDWIVFTGDDACSNMLFRAIAGMVRMKRGSIEVDGKCYLEHRTPVSDEKKMALFSYMSTKGSLLSDRSVSYVLKVKKAFYPEFSESGFRDMARYFDIEKQCPKKTGRLTENERAKLVLCLGMNQNAAYWLLDASCLVALSQEERAYVYHKIADFIRAGGTCLMSVSEELVYECETVGTNRIAYLFNGGIIADEPMIMPKEKTLSARMLHWKRILL